MKRLAEENINTPEHFDKIWPGDPPEYQGERLVWFTDQIQKTDLVLDAGAGRCGFAEFRCEIYRDEPDYAEQASHVWAIDWSLVARLMTLRRFPEMNYVLGSILDMPFRDNFFDVVGSSEVIEHMDDPELLVAEMARVVKPGGLLLIGTVDPDSENAHTHGCEYPEHVWQYTPDDLLAFLAPYGKSEYERVGDYDHVRCHVS